MGDVVGMVTGTLGSVKGWFMAGGTIWLAAITLMALMWVSRWSGSAELRWWTSLGCAVAFVSCLVMVLLGDPVNINAAANWGARWLYPIGGMFLFYVAEHAKFVLQDGGGAKKSAEHH